MSEKYQKLIYMASPYFHEDPAIVRQRVAQTQTAVAKLIEQGELVFSPIVHSDPIAPLIHFSPFNTKTAELSGWMAYDTAFIDKCDEVWILMLPGYENSVGVNTEIAYAISQGITRRYIKYPSLQIDRSYEGSNTKIKSEVVLTPDDSEALPVIDRVIKRLAKARKIAYQTEAVVDRVNAKAPNDWDPKALQAFFYPNQIEAVEEKGYKHFGPPHEVSINGNDMFGHSSNPKPLKLIGLTGHAQSGKDTAGKYLVENHGFVRIGLADAVKEALYALDPQFESDISRGHIWTVQRMVDDNGWEKAKLYNRVREYLQKLGTEVGRNIFGEDCWIRIAERKIKELGPEAKVVITDVRFPNEAEWVRSLGGEVWRVVRDGVGPVNDHASDQALDISLIDAGVANNGAISDLYDELDRQLLSYNPRYQNASAKAN